MFLAQTTPTTHINTPKVTGYHDLLPNAETYIVKLKNSLSGEQLQQLSEMKPNAARRSAAYELAADIHKESMKVLTPTLDALKSSGELKSLESLPAGNILIVNLAKKDALQGVSLLADNAQVEWVKRNEKISVPLETPEKKVASKFHRQTPRIESVNWGIDKVNARALWEQGFTGEGVTIGIVDTGVDVEHEALKSTYRGFSEDSEELDHSYNYYDAYGVSPDPIDNHGHGTHVAGISNGSNLAKETGIAPDAKWIGVRMMARDKFTGDTYTTLDATAKALEWIMAPTDIDGANPDPSKAPEIVNNSWSIGGADRDDYLSYWDAFEAAGMIVVTAAGNSGGKEGSITSPGTYPYQITVANTMSSDKLAASSGRGPSPHEDTDSHPKPTVAAPGTMIYSAKPGGGYVNMSGTSMATPNVSGVIALLKSANPDLTREDIIQAFAESSVDIDKEGIDIGSGYGRIDAEAAR